MPVPGCNSLHADSADNILFQLAGRKRLRVVAPDHSSRYPINGIWQLLSRRALSTHPLPQATWGPWSTRFRGPRGTCGVDVYEVVLEAGDAVTIPAGVLHSPYGSLESVSVNTFLIPKGGRSMPRRMGFVVYAAVKDWGAKRVAWAVGVPLNTDYDYSMTGFDG